MKLQLLTLLNLNPPSDVKDTYDKSHKFSVTIEGETLEYAFCSQKFLDTHAGGSRLGYKEDNMIFVSKNLHPTIVPFVALELFYRDLGKEDLEKRFGQGVFEELYDQDRKMVVLASVMCSAQQLLHPGHYASFFSLQNEDTRPELEGMVPQQRSTDIVQAGMGIETKNNFAFERVSAYLDCYSNNKWVRASRSNLGMAKTNRSTGKYFLPYVSRADIVVDELCQDKVLESNLSALADLTAEIALLKPGTQIELDKAQSYALFAIHQSIVASGKAVPFSFVGGNRETGENTIELGGRAVAFFESLNKGIAGKVLHQYRTATEALKGVDVFVQRVEAGNRGMAEQVYQLAESYKNTAQSTALVPVSTRGTLEKARSELAEFACETRHVVAGSPFSFREVERAMRAKTLLQGLGLPTGDVDAKLEQLLGMA